MLNKALLISTIILVINFFFQININLSLIKIKNVDKYILNYMSYSFSIFIKEILFKKQEITIQRIEILKVRDNIYI